MGGLDDNILQYVYLLHQNKGFTGSLVINGVRYAPRQGSWERCARKSMLVFPDQRSRYMALFANCNDLEEKRIIKMKALGTFEANYPGQNADDVIRALQQETQTEM